MAAGEILIALVTSNSRFYYEATRALKGRGIEFLSLRLSDEIPSGVRVVLTSEGERDKVRFREVVSGSDIPTAVSRCVRIFKGVGEIGRLVIGIDPGLKPGIAVLADELVVEVDTLRSPEETPAAVERAIRAYPAGETLIRIGRGGGIYNMRIVRALQGRWGLPMETVDETSTTPNLGRGASSDLRDAVAAVNIALKKGRPLNERIVLRAKPGEIRELQKESRKISGHITISKGLAERVARGEISLEDAVEEHRNGSAGGS